MTQSTTSPPMSGADDETRVLHRTAPLDQWEAPKGAGPLHMKVAVLDLETTGLDPQYDEIIEIAAAIIQIDAQGCVIAVENMRTGLQQPSRPIEPHIARITGIDDAMVGGKRICPDSIAAYLGQAHACLCFNAEFDRRHLEELVPQIGEMPWICAMRDVPWRELGFDGAAQNYLLAQAGMFNPVAHRARDDVASLIHLLAHKCRDGRTVMSHALEGAQAPSWRFEATNLPWRLRKEVARRGYRYSFRGVNHKVVRPSEYNAELAWYRSIVGEDPSILQVDWVQRYRADWTWEPVKRAVEVVSWRR